ncbi:cysteine desulfurase family protein [Rhodopirellula sp. MGV]|uniref:cysteine desulfurase family protein n=1 Tax=Rhodopirellula sp. MGV TaxID=2023130 RepID=UPI000B9672CE|nr:cysteine desulfurase family protein [Rhodopirellula sp. MGV]OYP35456.1 hypothetical protein CGZ80_11480 [Rhodopirellula sp. MGV]PNY33896.1 cysteine desulfurase [Rhodopirellula baltica]
MIYLDYAATTPMDPRVADAMSPFQTQQFGNPNSRDHAMGWDANDAIERARSQVASLINASPEEIIFTGSATESVNLAIKGLAFGRMIERLACRWTIVTTAVEHAAVRSTCQRLQQLGIAETVVNPVDRSGQLELAQVNAAIKRESTLALVAMHANNETGVLFPIDALAEITHQHDTYLVTDATQSVGKIEVDVREIPVDFLAFSAHKLYGPKGIGALYVRGGIEAIPLAPLIDGGGQERGLRGGTQNVAAIVGFGKACELAGKGLADYQAWLTEYHSTFEGTLIDLLPDVVVNGGDAARIPSISNLRFPSICGQELIREMQQLAVSQRSACASHPNQGSHVLEAMGQSPEDCRDAIRFSFGRDWNCAAEEQPSAGVVAQIVADAVLSLRTK